MSYEQALQTFLAESRELLASLEDALMLLEGEAGNRDAIDEAFRAVHTIKGSAGLFGLDGIVRFAHEVENVLDRVRASELQIDEGLVALLLECCDHISRLVAQTGEAAEPAAADDPHEGSLLARLAGHSTAVEPASRTAPPALAAAELESLGTTRGSSGNWHISVRFGAEVLRNGMDPASFVRYLGRLGRLASVTAMFDGMPDAESMDPEQCYLGFEIQLESDASKEEIESVLEFVREDSRIRILPPYSRIEEFVDLIDGLPEDSQRIGEILVASGALTQVELDEALSIQQAAAGRPPRLGEMLVEEHVVHQEVVEAALEKQQRNLDRRAVEGRYVRVDAQKLEELINQVGETVIASASASLCAHRSGDPTLQEMMSHMGRLVEMIRDTALSLRMVQIGETFHRFRRIVRDAGRELGKDIQLSVRGADTELDKTVVEKISDPLTHLVRNAIDHGIEPAPLRLQRGKPARGTVTLDAYHDSGSIVIEVGDDGGGLDRERILKRAAERGLVDGERTLSDTDVFSLIFEPGFSTADKVSDLSGRGVGMDVVRSNIQALRGSVELSSIAGQGTKVRIRLPLTLAIIDGFLVRVDRSSLVIPLDMVLECMELPEAERGRADVRHYLNLRGEVLPFIRLRDLLAVEGAPPRRENVVVVQHAGHKAGLVVDELHGELQTVIKPLGKLFRHLRGISGSTILGSGEVALILDVPALVAKAVDQENEAARTGGIVARRPAQAQA